jgi:hypothetical protein
MSDPLLTILKFFLLALLWLFFLRVLRSVWVEIRTAAAAEGGTSGAEAGGRPGAVPASRPAPARPPRTAAGEPTGAVMTAVGGAGRGGPSAEAARRLRVVEPAEEAGRIYVIDGSSEVGRAPGAAISLSGDSYVSSRHARIWTEGGTLWAEDLGSTNGSQINGRVLEGRTRLRSGDKLQFGRTVMEVLPA